MKYDRKDGVDLYLGDCVSVMRSLAAESVNIVITSPPYNTQLAYEQYSDNLPEDEYESFSQSWLSEAYRVAADGARAYVCIDDRLLRKVWDWSERIGWVCEQPLIWCKPNLAAGGNRLSGPWNRMHEWILLLRKGRRLPMQFGVGTNFSWFVIPAPQTNWKLERKVHVAQWPVALPLRLLSRTRGDVVLDPFCGAGSALLAARLLGRRAVGIDCDHSALDLTVGRLESNDVRKETLGLLEA